MTTENVNGGAPTAQSTESLDNQNSLGGDQTHEGSNNSSANNEDSFKTKMDQVYRKGRSEGLQKAQAELNSFLEELGAESLDELKEVYTKATESNVVDENLAKYKEAKKQHQELMKQYESMASNLQRLQKVQDTALETKITQKLMSLGAHEKGAKDLYKLIKSSLQWNEDFSEVEVGEFEGKDFIPSAMSLDEFLESQKKERSFFFSDSGKSGSGSGQPVTTPHVPFTPRPISNFSERIKR